VKNTAMTTIGKEKGSYPTSEWKKQILLSEHSPIRKIRFSWKWFDLKSWVSVHFVRHKVGIEHFVRTQRTDRTGIDRDNLPQGSFVEHECEADAQAIINISRKRLCSLASPETYMAWQEFLNSIKDIEPELYDVCVPECIYRNGICPEFNSCGFNKTKQFEDKLANYIKGIEKQINPNLNILNKRI
jgi:hypothetical protein